MKRVPADEFARHASEYLEGTEPVLVEKDGAVIGQYVPSPNGHAWNGVSPEEERRQRKAELRAHFARLRPVLQEIYSKTGMNEDEYADLFDTEKPFPHDVDPQR